QRGDVLCCVEVLDELLDAFQLLVENGALLLLVNRVHRPERGRLRAGQRQALRQRVRMGVDQIATDRLEDVIDRRRLGLRTGLLRTDPGDRQNSEDTQRGEERERFA